MCSHGLRVLMVGLAKSGKTRWVRKARVFLAGAALGLGVALIGAGCQSPQHAANDKLGDPLLGPALPPQTPIVQASAPAGLGPIPPTGGTTTAALAGQSSPGLAIGSADGWARKFDGVPSSGANASGALKTPIVPVSQPKVVPVPSEPGATPAPVSTFQPSSGAPTNATPVVAAVPAAVPSAESLDALLTSRGVIGKKKEDVPGGIRLVCAVTNPANPNANQIYETTAIDYATAVQAIVAQIDAKR